MDSGNRSFLAPKHLSFALALCFIGTQMGSDRSAIGDDEPLDSGVKNAVAVIETDSQASAGEVASPPGSIQQVVGKQPGSRRYRYSSSPGSQSTGQSGQGVQPIRSILGGFFQGSRNDSDQKRSAATPVDMPREPVNWEGIPYHQARSTNRRAVPNTPIRDPRPGEARVLARGSKPPLKVTPESTQQAIPKPPALENAPSSRRPSASVAKTEAKPVPRMSAPRLSNEASSRRGGRRDVPSLDASELAAAQNGIGSDTAEDVLVPKVSRRRIGNDAPQVAKTQPKPIAKKPADSKPLEKNDAVVAKQEPARLPATNSVPAVSPAPTATPVPTAKTPAADIAAKRAPEPSQPSAPEVNKPATEETIATTAPQTAIASVAPAQPTVQAPVETPKATLQKPTVAKAPTAVAQAPTHVPLAPAATAVAQRSGPPASTFVPSTQFQTRVPEQMPALPAPDSPIGSGVAAPSASGVTFRPPTTPAVPSSIPGYGQPPAYSPYRAPQQPYAMAPGTPNYQHPSALNTSAAPHHRVAQAPAAPRYPADPYAAGRAFPNQNVPPQMAAAPPALAHSAPPATTAQPAIVDTPAFNPSAVNQTPATNQAPAVPSQTAPTFNETPFAAEPTPRPRPAVETRGLEPGRTAVASELPGLRVVTHGPSKVMIRQIHPFEIRVENRGSIDATGVMVRAIVPDWAEVRGQTVSRGVVDSQSSDLTEKLIWTIDSLPAGASEKMLVRLKAERSGTHGLDVDWTLIPQKSVTQIEVSEPQLALQIEGPEEVVYGESQTYKVRVLNPGDGIAPNIVFTLSPNSPTPQTQRIGDIPAGKEAQFEVELTAQDLGDLKIHGLASGDLELRTEASKTIRVSAAKLSAVMNGPELKYQDTQATYNLQLQNDGDASCKEMVATLHLPLGAKYLGGIDGAKQRGSVLTWTIDSLAPTAVRDYQFECMMNAPGDQTFAFNCKGSAAGETSVSLDTRVEAIADLVLTIQDPAAPAPVGTEVTYEILIRNRGSKDATGVRAIAQFSHGIEPRRVEGHSGEVLTGQVLFDPIASIAAGGELRLRVVAEAARGGHHRFRTEVRSGETVLVAEEATHYMNKRSERVSSRSTPSGVK